MSVVVLTIGLSRQLIS